MDQVYWVTEVEIRDGQADAFKELMTDMVAATRADEPGTLVYEWSTTADGTICHLYERFADADAAMVHLRNFRPFAGRWGSTFKPLRLTVYGAPSDAVLAALAAAQPVTLTLADGFAR